jgi:hypothetical protein
MKCLNESCDYAKDELIDLSNPKFWGMNFHDPNILFKYLYGRELIKKDMSGRSVKWGLKKPEWMWMRCPKCHIGLINIFTDLLIQDMDDLNQLRERLRL